LISPNGPPADFGVLNTFDGKQFNTAATRGLHRAYDEYRRSLRRWS
jgi:hypothetical protein